MQSKAREFGYRWKFLSDIELLDDLLCLCKVLLVTVSLNTETRLSTRRLGKVILGTTRSARYMMIWLQGCFLYLYCRQLVRRCDRPIRGWGSASSENTRNWMVAYWV